jgi:hypothetical protein
VARRPLRLRLLEAGTHTHDRAEAATMTASHLRAELSRPRLQHLLCIQVRSNHSTRGRASLLALTNQWGFGLLQASTQPQALSRNAVPAL